jgi:hypothetical protein
MRGINQRFINDLKSGILKDFLSIALYDPRICLEIRKNYINLYYKGGNALRIKQLKTGYNFKFDSKYCLHKNDDRNYEYLSTLNKKNIDEFKKAFPVILNEMDSFFAVHDKPERIFQHNLIKQNQDELKVLDIEYQGRTREGKQFRLDMLGVLKIENGFQLVIFENKLGTGAIGGKAGLIKHYDDFVNILNTPATYNDLIGSVINIANNKTVLGLTDLPLNIEQIKSVEILFVVAGFNNKSKSISNAVGNIIKSIPAKIIFMDPTEMKIDFSKVTDLFQ